jgi:hypothetical protein
MRGIGNAWARAHTLITDTVEHGRFVLVHRRHDDGQHTNGSAAEERLSWTAKYTSPLGVVVVASAVLIAVVVVGAVIVSGTARGKGTTGARSAASSGLSRSINLPAGKQAPASAAHAGVTAPPRAAVTRGAKWVTGPAGKLIASVDADLGRIGADERAGKSKAAKGIAGQLIADARAADRGPMPPVDAALYRSALKEFEQVGTDTARGDFHAASSLLTAATLGIMTVTAAADATAPVNSAAALNDPS